MTVSNESFANRIYNEDCFATMNRMACNSIDLILTSPPYNTARLGTNQRAFDNYENRYDVHLDNKTNEEYLDWSVELFNAYERVLKPNGCVLYNISYSSENTELIWLFVAEIIQKTKFTTADSIIWKKSTALPNNVSPNKLTRIVEFVFVFVRKQELDTFYMNKKITSQADTGQNFYENKYNFFEAPNNDGSNDLNKATFSTDFARNLILLYAKPNSLVFDSFMGTGTTAEACIIEKMNFIGSEISSAQCEYSDRRIRKKLSEPTLF